MNIEKVGMIQSVILSESGYVPVNKALVKKIGLLESIVYGELVNKCIGYSKIGRLNEFGEFWWTIPQVEEELTIPKRQQATIFKHLEDLGLIIVNNRVPKGNQRAVRHIRVVDKPSVIRNLLQTDTQAETPLERVATF